MTAHHGYVLLRTKRGRDRRRPMQQALVRDERERAAPTARGTGEVGLALEDVERGPPARRPRYERFRAGRDRPPSRSLRWAALERSASTPTSPAARHAEMVGELEAADRRAPLASVAGTVMMAGALPLRRKAEALEAYRQARREAVAEVGLEPAETQERSSGRSCAGSGSSICSRRAPPRRRPPRTARCGSCPRRSNGVDAFVQVAEAAPAEARELSSRCVVDSDELGRATAALDAPGERAA